jgi:head-tail adaptor
MSAGRRDKPITLRGYTETTDAWNSPVVTWSTLGNAKAAVFFGRGSERRQAAQEQGQQAATFQIVNSEMARAVTLKDKIAMDGFLWDIVGINPDTPRRGLIEFDATATGLAA